MGIGTLSSYLHYKYKFILYFCLASDTWEQVARLPLHIVFISPYYHIHIILLSGPLIFGNRYPVSLFILYMHFIYIIHLPGPWHEATGTLSPYSYHTHLYYTSVKFLLCIHIILLSAPDLWEQVHVQYLPIPIILLRFILYFSQVTYTWEQVPCLPIHNILIYFVGLHVQDWHL